MLSTTYIVDVYYEEEGKEDGEKSIFVKVPLTGEASKDFKQVGVLSGSLAENISGWFRSMWENTRCTPMYCLTSSSAWRSAQVRQVMSKVGPEKFNVFLLQNVSFVVM